MTATRNTTSLSKLFTMTALAVALTGVMAGCSSSSRSNSRLPEVPTVTLSLIHI